MADKYKEYVESEAVRQAKANLEAQAAQKPGAYQSQWQQSLNDTINKIQNREKFSYDLNGDALYQQYKDRYIQQGQQAMMDTMGQAAALTGGYGNSYAQSVGQQTYQGYLQGLNDKVPELYQLALNKYQMEGDELYNQYGLLADRENNDYGRYRDSMSDYYTERDYLTNQYNAERDYDYSKFADDRNFNYQVDRDAIADSQWQQQFDESMRQWNESFAYQQNRDQISDAQWQKQFDESNRQWNEAFQYQQNRDQISDSQWQKEFDEAQRQFNQNYALSSSKSSGGGGGGSSGGSGGSSGGSGSNNNPYGFSTEYIKNLQRQAGITVDGIWGPQTQAAYDALPNKTKGPSNQSSKPTYDSIVSDLNGYIRNGASKSEISNYLLSAYRSGYITQAEYTKLRTDFVPRGMTY